MGMGFETIVRLQSGYCLVTPPGGGGGLSWASARAQPPTHPPTQPYPRGGGGG